MSLAVIFTIILVHWFGDFVLQTDEQAKRKSKDSAYLLAHISTYSLAWVFIVPILFVFVEKFNVPNMIIGTSIFYGVTFMSHLITDYFTSRLNAKLWAKGDVHNFFVSVGFDQVLHYVQLFLTYKLCLNIFA